MEAKKPVKKEKKPDLKEFTALECQKHKNIILMDINKDVAFIIKKKTEIIRREHNSGTMNPVEYYQEMNFFHAFIVRFKSQDKKVSEPMLNILKEKDFPIYYVQTEYDIIKSIKDA